MSESGPLLLSRAQARSVDRLAVDEYGMTGLVLMENAGRGAADLLVGLDGRGPVVICCGRGNNAGDGFVIARHLDSYGMAVRVCLWARPESLRGDAAANYRVLERCDVPIAVFGAERDEAAFDRQLDGAAWIVDALLGTGAQGEPREPFRGAIDQINRAQLPILAVDLPSGLDCDLGPTTGHIVRAAHTATFVAAKPGFFAPGAAELVGQVHVLPIGVPRKLIERVRAESSRPRA